MKKLFFQPKTDLEKFGARVYKVLVENFPGTFFMGGMVRDLLLNKKNTDIDIATSARPTQVAKILTKNKIQFDDRYARFGIINAFSRKNKIEIATFRKDLASKDRYPKVKFMTSPKLDSIRRDFTINALYLRAETGDILDFHSGLKDLKKLEIKFIGNPVERIKQDPLRVIRALRFQIQLGLKLETNTASAIKKYFALTKTLTKSKLASEINKLPPKKQKQLQKLINNYA